MKQHYSEYPKHSQYHFFEVCICGFSNSGKTTLTSRLIRKLSEKYDVGYAKSDAHFFRMDHEGKDTAVAWESGAKAVHIFDKNHLGYIKKGNVDTAHRQTLFENCDFVLVEGQKYSSIPKIVLVGGKGDILSLVENEEITDVIAFVGVNEQPDFATEKPYFQRDDINTLSEFICKFLKNKVLKKLNGLVLAGGKSRRMNADKALISFGQKTQLKKATELLQLCCDEVFISTRPGQRSKQQTGSFSVIEDRFLDFGPLGGILSAQMYDSKSAWLVVACDLPLLNIETLSHLIKKRNYFKFATVYKSVHDDMPEPLCTIYEPRSFLRFMQFLAIGYKCPRKMLLNSSVEILEPICDKALTNMNTPLDVKKIKEKIKIEK